MRRLVIVVTLLVSSSFALDFTVRVVNPYHAAVPYVRVELSGPRARLPVRVAFTSAEGLARFSGIAFGFVYRVEVFAPGYARLAQLVRPEDSIPTVTLRLHPAAPGQTINVSATLRPLLVESATPSGPIWNPSDSIEAPLKRRSMLFLG